MDRWLPLFSWNDSQVWAEIVASGLPWHPAYFWVPRLSCVICVLAPREQLVIAARLNPALVREYLRVERIVGHSLKPGLSMLEIAAEAGIDPTGSQGDQPGQLGVPTGPGVAVPWVPIPDMNPALARLIPPTVVAGTVLNTTAARTLAIPAGQPAAINDNARCRRSSTTPNA